MLDDLQGTVRVDGGGGARLLLVVGVRQQLDGAVILVHLLLLQLALDDSSRDVDLPVVVRRLRIRRAYLGHGLLWCHFTRRHHVSHEGERVLDQQLCAATRDAVPALREHLILQLRLLVQGQGDIPVVEDLLDGAPRARLRQLLLRVLFLLAVVAEDLLGEVATHALAVLLPHFEELLFERGMQLQEIGVGALELLL